MKSTLQRLGAMAATAGLVGVGFVGFTATGASAAQHDDAHYCGRSNNTILGVDQWDDTGIASQVHDTVEPVLAPVAPLGHNLNCLVLVKTGVGATLDALLHL